MKVLKHILSYLTEVPIAKYTSQYSGTLTVALFQGKKILNTTSVNYSFRSLHRVFQKALKYSQIQLRDTDNALVLGMGAGSIPQLLRYEHQFTGNITAVEIDPEIIKIAEEHFQIRSLQPIDIINKDAVSFISETDQTFGLICIDLFINIDVPSEVLTPEFFEHCLSKLNNNGILLFNIMLYNKKLTEAFQLLQQTIEEIHVDFQFNHLELEENNYIWIAKRPN